MKKRLLSLLLSAALLCGALPTAFAGYENFTPKTTYTDGRFSDVSSSDWFYENVRASYEYDLINGYNDGKFHPDDDLTIAQAVKLAACLNSLYSSATADFSAASPWQALQELSQDLIHLIRSLLLSQVAMTRRYLLSLLPSL